MKTYQLIHLLVPCGTNFTPAALMRRWAKAHNKPCGNGQYFEQYIVIDGKQYVYDHYVVRSYLTTGKDAVTLYLTEKEDKV